MRTSSAQAVLCVGVKVDRLHTTAGAGTVCDHALMEPHEPYIPFHAMS